MIKVLDHGYVKHIESWGTGEMNGCADKERGIIEAARQSTQGSFRGWEQDRKLLNYLYKHKHSTPFEFAGMIIEVRAPIMVFREWHRHRTQSYNEMSARYAPLPNANYVPSKDRCLVKSDNKQAGKIEEAAELHPNNAEHWLGELEAFYREAERMYQYGLNIGIPKELARLCIPVGRYTQMRAAANLRNWLGFLTLRLDPDAQKEIRLYAEAVGQIISQQFPKTWELFSNNR